MQVVVSVAPQLFLISIAVDELSSGYLRPTDAGCTLENTDCQTEDSRVEFSLCELVLRAED